ncbi:helix-turn-helix transcriptional regulator [Streptomyces sp. NPDC002577]
MCHPSWGRARTAAHRRGDLARLRRVRDRIDREYAQPLNVEALARGVNMSAGHLSRQFRLAYGESPYTYLMTRRIERAAALLRRGELSVTEVCFAVGSSPRRAPRSPAAICWRTAGCASASGRPATSSSSTAPPSRWTLPTSPPRRATRSRPRPDSTRANSTSPISTS